MEGQEPKCKGNQCGELQRVGGETYLSPRAVTWARNSLAKPHTHLL